MKLFPKLLDLEGANNVVVEVPATFTTVSFALFEVLDKPKPSSRPK